MDIYDADDLAVFAISTQDDKTAAEYYVSICGYNFTEWGFDPDPYTLFDLYNEYLDNNWTIPHTYIIDADRNLRWAIKGDIGFTTTLTKVLDELI